jgi:hypothetical protein
MESWFGLRLSIFSFAINMTALAYTIFNYSSNGSLVGLLLTYSGTLNDDIISFVMALADF